MIQSIFRHLRVGAFVTLLAFIIAVPVHAQAITTPGNFVVLMDGDTGEILYEKESTVPMAPASMSKLMTLAVLFDAIDQGVYSLDDTFTVSKKAWQRVDQKCGSLWAVRFELKI